MNILELTYEANGNYVAVYYYDAWGRITAIDTADAEGETACLELANANPLRYRGYYYDNETGYYYLQSRYYDPEICRFINADVPEIAKVSKSISNGVNIFAYCNNNPINDSDPNGQLAAKKVAELIFGIITGLIAQLIADGICIMLKLQKGLSTVGKYISNIAQSALDALLHKGIYKAIIVAAIGNGIKQILNRIIDKKPISLSNYLYTIVKTGIKYVIKSKLKVRINAAIEKKIEQKFPFVLGKIVNFAYQKLKKVYVKTISYKAIKNVISSFSSSLWNYSKGCLLNALK